MGGVFPLTEPKPVILNSYCLGWDSSQKRVSWSNYVKSCCCEWMCEISGFPVFLRSDSSMERSNAVVSCGEGQEGQPQLSLFVLPLKLKQKLLVH